MNSFSLSSLERNPGAKMKKSTSIKIILAELVCLAIIIVIYKVIAAGNAPAPQNVMDPQGVMGETLQADLTLSPGYTQEALPGQTVGYTHVLANTGTMTGTFSLAVTSSLHWPVALFNETHPATVLLPVQLGAGMTTTVGVSVTVPTTALSGTIAHTTITATLLGTLGMQAVVTDVTRVRRVPSVVLSPGQSKDSTAGSMATFVHTITNTGPSTDTFVIEAKSQHDWPVELLAGDQQTFTLQMPIRLAELESADFVVRVTVPEYISDTVDQIVITATSMTNGGVTSTITDTITVQTHTSLLPLLAQGDVLPRAKLGVDFGLWVIHPDTIAYDYPLVQDLGVDWIRVFLSWRRIETSPGQYDWSEYDAAFNRFRELGFKTITIVYGPPDWAAEESCGPISDTVALENFINLAIPRYADVTEAWEFINEPDGIEPQPKYGAMVGCWGLYPAEYARQLRIFSSRVRILDPGDLIFFGGLAYDAWTRFEKSFFETALQNGAASFFDGVSLHYYPINVAEFPTMAHKINEIRDTMSANGVYNKLIWITETSMWTNGPDGLEAQLDYIVQEQSRGFGAGADNIFWFAVTQEGESPPLHRWLINMDHETDNGYYTYQHFAAKIQGLHCTGAYAHVPQDIEAYEFTGPDRSIYILWSNTITKTVRLPASTDAVLTNRDGNQSIVLPVQAGAVEFEVGPQPVFVEIITGN